MRRAGWINRLTFALIALLLLPDTSMAMADEPKIGKLVSLLGQVAVRHSSDTPLGVGQDRPIPGRRRRGAHRPRLRRLHLVR